MHIIHSFNLTCNMVYNYGARKIKKSNKYIMQKLQNHALRKINFKKLLHPIKHIYKDHKILFWNLLTSSKFKTVFSCISLNTIIHLLPLFILSTPMSKYTILNWHSILLIFSFVLLQFCFLYFFSYYCLRYCCPIIII